MDVTALAGPAAAAGVLLAATVLGLWWRRRQGAVRPARPAADPGTGRHLALLGVTPGAAVTLLQFSSAFCAPCRATRVICGQVADGFEGVRHVEVDAESHLDQVRVLGVWRTPTVLIVDTAGRIVSRITGRPTRAAVTAAVDPLLPQPCGVGRT